MKKNKILGASLGNCVHVAGVKHFLDLAEDAGWEAVYLGPAVPPEAVLSAIEEEAPDVAAVGYRLTEENARVYLARLKEGAQALKVQPVWVFGGTRRSANAARELNFFNVIYDGREDLDDCIAFLKGEKAEGGETRIERTLTGRIRQKKPYPLLRHHFGLPDYSGTLSGVGQIAESRVLDVISLGIDQNTQQAFFHPERREAALEGAGGVPVRTEAEFRALYDAAQTGNFPLMRCYSGTADVLPMGEMLLRTIDNAWCAVPLCWYGELDGRGTRTLEEGIRDAQALMRLHAGRGVPVEVNEPHHWALRDAHDTITVAMAYLSALNARAMGVTDYVAQLMFNVPPSLSFSMDLAKALAQMALVKSLETSSFHVLWETRAGLPMLSGDLDCAKGQLAASTMLQMAVKPDILHVVGFSEAEYAATPEVIIESCKIVRGVIRQTLSGMPDFAADPAVQARRDELISEAGILLDTIRNFYRAVSPDPLTDPGVLADCVRLGILDAPHILKRGSFRGSLRTRVVDGKCVAWNEGRPMGEEERLAALTAQRRYT